MIVCAGIVYEGLGFKKDEKRTQPWVWALLLLCAIFLPYCQIKYGCHGDIQGVNHNYGFTQSILDK